MLLSTYSQSENGEDPLVFFGEPLNHVITIHGQILVSRTNDDPLLPRVYVQNALRVYRHHAHMLKHMCAWCRHTQGRFECTHGGVLNVYTVLFSRFFTVPQHTNTQHDHQQHHDHNDTHHITQHGDRNRERQRKRDRKETRRWKRRDKKRPEKMKEERRNM